MLYLQFSRCSQHTVLYNICISSLYVNTKLNKCFYLFTKQLEISGQVEYRSIDSAILVARLLILDSKLTSFFQIVFQRKASTKSGLT